MSRDDRHRAEQAPGPERDEQLGAALRGLPVPDHQPRFWAELAQTLAGEPAHPAPAAGIPTKETQNVIPLDERQPRRRRFHLPAGVAAALVVVLAAGGVLWAREDDSRVEVADRPGPGAGTTAPAMLIATYDVTGLDAGSYRLTLARDGSYRWTSEDGNSDTAYDAATGRAVGVLRGSRAFGKASGDVYTGVPPGGPEQGLPFLRPDRNLAHFVTALGRSGDGRVKETSAFGRPAWRYDGPQVADQLGANSPDHVIAEVDQATGVLLSRRETLAGQPTSTLVATSVETSDELDRSRFQLEVPPTVEKRTEPEGFRPVSLDKAPDLAGYEPLVPANVPPGFHLEAVAVDPDVPRTTGAEGMNPPATHIVALRYSNGFYSFTVTQRPKGNPPYPWADPFGAEGMSYKEEPVNLALPGRPHLEGSLVVDAPSVPHLWGITGDLVVTIDGDLGPTELRQVAGSLQTH
jgi:hypothetical protein